MKQIVAAATLILLISCSKSDNPTTTSSAASTSTPCGTYNGHTLYKGSQNGCYYKKSNGNKVYVDRTHCRC